MGGTSTSSQNTSQQSQTTPWAPASGGLTNLLSGLNPSIANLNGGPQVQNALTQLQTNAQNPNPFGTGAVNAGMSLLNGGQNIGGATNILQQGYNGVSNALSPYLSGNAMDPSSNPALAQQLNTVNQQVQNAVNPMFSAAGRLASPANAQALARGIAQGDTGILQNAAGNQLQAAGLLNSAAGGTASGLTNADVANAGILGSGINNAENAYNAQNFGPQELLSAALFGNQLPIQNASSLSGILGPLAAQFGQTNSTGTSNGTNTMSGAQQFALLGQGAAGFGKFLFG